MSELQLFRDVAANYPSGNPFNLNFRVHTSCNIGQVIPILCEEAVPGDYWKIALELGIRCQPLNAPINDSLTANVDYFFVPYRLLDKDWVKFITGGTNGDYVGALPTMPWATSLSDSSSSLTLSHSSTASDVVAKPNSFWDYIGHPLPTDLDWGSSFSYGSTAVPNIKVKPLAYPWLAYNMIRWYYYTDQNLNPDYMDNKEWQDLPQDYIFNNEIFNRPYKKDYFTSALPFQQRGIAPSLPLSGYLPVVANQSGDYGSEQYYFGLKDDGTSKSAYFTVNPSSFSPTYGADTASGSPKDSFLYASADGASSFTVSEMRQVFAIQKWMELNARGGARYNEFLKSHFGICPDDRTLQRPEYLGSVKFTLAISEVLQQSSTASGGALGDYAGHGIGYGEDFVDAYKVEEFGIVIGLLSVMPRQSYFQGINRQWLRRSRFDFYFPEFANLSEQGIYNAELYIQNDSADPDNDFLDTINGQVFGFQGVYDEMRIKQDRITGQMRGLLDYWHTARKFATPPALNEDFITTKDTDFDRLFAVQDEHQLIVIANNKLSGTIRPMPDVPDPGLIDHVY